LVRRTAAGVKWSIIKKHANSKGPQKVNPTSTGYTACNVSFSASGHTCTGTNHIRTLQVQLNHFPHTPELHFSTDQHAPLPDPAPVLGHISPPHTHKPVPTTPPPLQVNLPPLIAPVPDPAPVSGHIRHHPAREGGGHQLGRHQGGVKHSLRGTADAGAPISAHAGAKEMQTQGQRQQKTQVQGPMQ
jgi:hypothetical protein